MTMLCLTFSVILQIPTQFDNVRWIVRYHQCLICFGLPTNISHTIANNLGLLLINFAIDNLHSGLKICSTCLQFT